MKILRTVEELTNCLAAEKEAEIGFVPTMGFLHEGHLTLIREARRENSRVVVSVFVNPTQFGPDEDFESYPRDEKRDAELAEAAGADFLFIPSTSEMYPAPLSVTFTVTKRTDVLDGAKRPGHFDGVVTVLAKLFQLVQPKRAYFGQKDAQQVAVVKNFVADYFFPVEIRTVPTVREEDGLARSSRNVYLTETERQDAPKLHQALLAGRLAYQKTLDTEKAYQAVREVLGETARSIDYLALLSFPDFDENLDKSAELILAIAVKYSKARLIDNEIFTAKEAGK
ncbi:pantoate--beta-alanine ligase [Listeria ilorinensis]|uniref:pantoate--beta-alanine ligase n=1 Tax=Listeria ilorinensis TaxID=2867439 RepID=UPI001EF4BB30|nr:pantoate--beta-alanine ligase [Listeria ilorinensis]